MYVKFFDVVWNQNLQEAIPTAVLQISDEFNNSPIDSLDIIPTIFIINKVFQQCPSNQLNELAIQSWAKIKTILPSKPFQEIQFDCDWTLSTRDAYFQFLKYFGQQISTNTKLSATIRLHQYRYPEKTGIPPVNKGMLMFYNMGDLQDWEEDNSILNLEKSRPYLQNKAYSLPLDLALPLFRWGVLFREEKMIKLINGLEENRLADTTFFEHLSFENSSEGTSRHRVKKSTYLDGYYLYKDDLLRLESVTPNNLQKAAKLLQTVVNNDTTWLSFYHLDKPLLEAYDYESLEECLEILSRPAQ